MGINVPGRGRPSPGRKAGGSMVWTAGRAVEMPLCSVGMAVWMPAWREGRAVSMLP